MDSPRNPDRLSSLPEILLVLIISNLPFKLAVKTSVLSQKWRDLHRRTTNIILKESEFLKLSDSNDEDEEKNKREGRVSFINSMVQWVSKFTGDHVESFHLCLFKPVGFETEINYFAEFAVSIQVKNLVLDFSDPSWTTSNEAAAEEASMFQLPECVYDVTSLESLKLFACGFDPSKVTKLGSIKTLSFGWIQLEKIMSLISKSPLLESLTMKKCWNVGLEAITGGGNSRLRVLIFENCDFGTLDLPSIQVFKYSGKVHYFQFIDVNRRMKEAYLDFEAETEYNDKTGDLLCGLLYDLLSAKKLTICPFLIQLIQDSEDPVKLQAPMETRHLVMKTNLKPNEFVGIRLMINSCPDLETLTFVMVPPRAATTTSALAIDPKTYWKFGVTHKCLKKTLKVVEVRNFSGGVYEKQMLQYLTSNGRVLEKVDIYLSTGLEKSQRSLVREALVAARFEKGSSRLRVYLHNGRRRILKSQGGMFSSHL